MLDTETKRRIDTARDILVGKVPDPKSQVEQITIALIYKFMDDMDAESEELGGKRKFFANDFSRYGWTKLMRSGLGGHETLNLYAEAIARMPENPGIPLLFREIFKNAYLPYRDPETLRAFLKVVDEFAYDHSERLGDAFEYLLSVLGSQGDAGQFRTPRHIIDFMVQVLDPRKTETILDPACGTAGFLISSYKHILKSNTDSKGHSNLTPEEKGKLAKNFKGYDISPDMVRLSLVNLYLHGFSDPHIYEYDTLTSQDRWNDYADVILANPPFMSPKGGIKPHKRFSVQSKRSEVLFVDYMAEHLSPNGRAAIIVPEGIIFQSQSAYVQLRKMLVDEYLVAVVSLPAGVFNPYSGVKTSILILDKSLAKQANTIAFFKIENDGFGLGAQRRRIDKNDLPRALKELNDYLNRIRTRQSLEDCKSALGRVVAKEKIAGNGDYNLSGERYKENSRTHSTFPIVELGEIFEITSSKRVFESEWKSEGVPFYRAREIVKLAEDGHVQNKLFISEDMFQEYASKYGAPKEGDMMVTGVGTLGVCYVVQQGDRFYFKDGNIIWLKKQTDNLTEYVKHLFQTDIVKRQIEQTAGATVGTFTIINAKRTRIPLPPLEVQKEIVTEIEGYQKVIDGARSVVDNYRPHIPINPEWPMVPISEVLCKSDNSVLPKSLTGPITYIGLENITQCYGELCGSTISSNPSEIKSLKNVFKAGDILYGKLRPNLNKVWLADRSGICSTDIFVLEATGPNILTAFYASVLRSNSFNTTVVSQIKGAQLPRIGWSSFAAILIPLPPLETQRAIVAEIEAEQALVNANRELIVRFEKKIQATLARIWGEEEKTEPDI